LFLKCFDIYRGLKTNLVLTTPAVNVNDGQLNQTKKSAIDFINPSLVGNMWCFQHGDYMLFLLSKIYKKYNK